MKVGKSHNWAYHGRWHEKKIKPGIWNIRFKATKHQKPMPGVRKGSKYHWKITAHQHAVKTKSGRYQTLMKGKKYLIKAKPKRR